MKTTLIEKRAGMERRPLPECHGGVGVVDWTNVLTTTHIPEAQLGFVHDDVLPPGASIGTHRHDHEEEYYYIVSGKGVMILDDARFEVESGDITAVFPGGAHGLENPSTEELRVIVMGMSRG